MGIRVDRDVNFTKGLRLLVRCLALCVVAIMLCGAGAFARNYYIATNGSDTNPGTITQPFLTIQRAANVMVAGDTGFVRAGTYREVVTPARSGNATAPITFRPYNDEMVTISGADVIPSGSWTLTSGTMYQTPMSWDLGEGANQVFLDGQMMIEARWPNTTLDVSHPLSALVGDGSYVNGDPGLSTGAITGLVMPTKPAGYWVGATLHIGMFRSPNFQGAGWIWQTGTVTSSATNQLSFTFQRFPTELTSFEALTPGPRNPYFLTGKLSELDAGSEWFRDSATSTLYFWTPASDHPSQHTVEVKRRQLAFNLPGRSFITIQGFNLFAASIFTDTQSQYIVLDGLKVQYVSHQTLITNPAVSFIGASNSGIILNGANNVLRNSDIRFSSGNGVVAGGAGQRIFNNVIHDADYAATEASPIAAGFNLPTTTGFLIAWNTAYNTGRHGILHTNRNPGTGHGRILHNEVYNYGIQTTDLGCIYTFGSEGNGTEIGYNVCHHDSATNLGTGIYLDFDSTNYIAHHNVVWSAMSSARMNSVSRNNRIYNNTFAAGTLGVGLVTTPGHDGTYQAPQSELKNNIFTVRLNNLINNSGAVLANNIFQGTDPQFVDPTHDNYQLKATSPAINAGLVIAPYTDGFTGNSPDIGAFETGLPAWKAGGGQPVAATVSAASYGPALTPESIATSFGAKLATGTAFASTVPLPTSLLGTTVTITDGAGVDHLAPLFYVYPTQIAFEIPPNTAPGIALITVTAADGTISLGSIPVVAVAPALFSADASGSGPAAAQLVRVRNGVQTSESALGPIDLGQATDQVILVLYGCGIRAHDTASSSVQMTIGGVAASVQYAGAQPAFTALDQVNVLIPRSLVGRGNMDVVMTVDGLTSNIVTINVR